jgi:hypothetical protein
MCAKVSANNFFVSIVLHFLNRFEFSIDFCNLWYLYQFFEYFLPILALFTTFIANDGRNGPRKRKRFFINVSQKPILHPFLYWETPFCQNRSKSLYPTEHYLNCNFYLVAVQVLGLFFLLNHVQCKVRLTPLA